VIHVTLHEVADVAAYTSTGLSLLYSVLPTVETFNGYPRFQKRYGLFLDIIKQLGANLRKLLYPSINTDGGSKISEAAASNQNPTPEPKQP
jgi:hypothetical protein